MSTLLEITGAHIAELGDADLRELIGLLCEADYGLAGLTKRGITWGGHQNAPDGGLDVVVRGTVLPPVASFVPRSTTGFQVRTSDMPRAKIIEEMRPKDILKKSIKTLIPEKGAYIIISSAGSTSNTALNNRISAMKEAVADKTGHENLHLDFFDRGRVATWVRSHPSLIIWVRKKIGKPLTGWQPYKNWARAPGGVEEGYLLDDGLRLHDRDAGKEQGLTVEDGLSRLRSALSMPRKCVRLVGLSGVGKTRLVQALFDDRVGKDAADPSLAIYTDMSDSPEPVPVALANQLINAQRRVILIIDNCSLKLHHSLAKLCSEQQSNISLLTVEYDVRDDIPEETNVFRLEPASDNIIEKLISNRFAHISQVDTRTIASLSGGNARVAIALASTVQYGETLSGFHNEQLFERLFQQRHTHDNSLLVSAQACSLVYSFEGTDTSSEGSEIKFLASLIGKSPGDLYRDVAELKRRDLIQSRGDWRAVLPQAIANRLAKRALESIPKHTLVNEFIGNSERLLKSFTRRLGYLHDCKEAMDIVNDWLGQDGWIGKNIDNLNKFELDILKNIAPVTPDKTLEAIERAASGSNRSEFISRDNLQIIEFVQLLRQLAYDKGLFHRSVGLLCQIALSEYKWAKNGCRSQTLRENPRLSLLLGQYGNQNYVKDELKSLFYLYLSGTHAPIEARVKIIEELTDSEDEDEQNLGISLLDVMLEVRDFSSTREFEFGARPRDEGYRPKSQKDEIHWYETAINTCVGVVLKDRPVAEQAKKILAEHLRGLWTDMEMFEYLEDVARKIRKHGAWSYGWIAVSGIMRYDGEGFNDAVKERLYKLKELLKPDSLLEKARTLMLSDQYGRISLEDGYYDDESERDRIVRVEEEARKIGVGVAQDVESLNALLPHIVSTSNSRVFNFGIGLADGSNNKKALFQTLYDEVEKVSPERRQVDVIRGFLSVCAKSDPPFHNSTLDSLVKDEVLGDWFPAIQISSTIDQRGLERLHEALDLGKANISLFQNLAYGCAHETINDNDLALLLKKIISKEDGVYVAFDIIKMRFYGKDKDSLMCSDELMTVAQNVLMEFSFDDGQRGQTNRDYELAQIVSICFDGRKGSHPASIMCQNIVKAISDNRFSSFNYTKLLNTLAKIQPAVFLEVFLEGERIKDFQQSSIFYNYSERRENPLDQISNDDLLSWCKKNPPRHYPLITTVLRLFKKSDGTSKYVWHPFIYSLLDKAPVLKDVLKNIADALMLVGGGGSRADALQRVAVLYQDLYKHENDMVANWAKNQYSKLQEEIVNTRERENKMERERNETFE